MSENKLGYNQASKYLLAITDVFYDVMESRKPADRALRNFFSENKQCGSKDRRFIAEGLYSLFRWYGWVKTGIPSEKPINPIECSSLREALLLCLNLENQTNSLAFKALCELESFTTLEFSEKLEEKAEQLEAYKGEKLRVEDLVPSWFHDCITGKDMSFYEALQKRPPVWIRTQRSGHSKVVQEFKSKEVEFSVSRNLPEAIKISGKHNLTAFSTYRQGLFEIQDLASQVLVSACSVKQNENWWDVCSGGGGKTLALADKIGAGGSVTATDKRKEVLQEVKKRSRRAGFRNVVLANLIKEKKSTTQYDGVLVDAPCSCTGTWRRNPDARWTREADVCQKWSEVQLQILSEVHSKVKVGGVLVYATCSSSFVENEEVVEKFLSANKQFELEPIEHPLTGKMTSGLLNVEALPEDCDTMFAARMIRKKK